MGGFFASLRVAVKMSETKTGISGNGLFISIYSFCGN